MPKGRIKLLYICQDGKSSLYDLILENIVPQFVEFAMRTTVKKQIATECLARDNSSPNQRQIIPPLYVTSIEPAAKETCNPISEN